MLWARLSVVGVLLLGACTIPNENHCGNHDGDQTCADRFDDATFCSICIAENDGCVAEMPEEACRFGGHDSDETGSEVTAASATLTSATSSPSTTASSASSSGSTSNDS